MKKTILAWALSISLLLGGCAEISNLPSFDSVQNSIGGTSEESITSNSSVNNDIDSDIEEEITHVDDNDDGICDDCGNTVEFTFDFYSINDLHGKFVDNESQPGVDELTTYLKQAREENPNTLFLSTGDMWQGGAESNLTKGKIVTEWMNSLDFTAMAIGNHEFDWGETYIEENSELAEFPFLAINIYDRETSALADYCQPSVLVEKSGVKIGVIGAIGDCYSSISGDFSKDIYFKTDSELTALVKAESNKLRTKGADFIIYAVHDGEENYDVSLSNGYVDLVFEGHTHQQYITTDRYGVPHLQGGGDNDGITHAEVSINIANGKDEIKEAEFISTTVYDDLEDDAIVAELLEKYSEEIAKADKVLGYNERVRSSNELLQLSAQLYLEKGNQVWGDTYDIVLGGGFMSARSPYNLKLGTIVYADLQMILPFDNNLVLCSIKGQDLLSFIDKTDSRYYIAYGDYGESVKDSIESEKTYYIVTDTFSSTYAPNRLTEVKRLNEEIFARDLIAEYIEKGGFGQEPELILTSISDILALGAGLNANEETQQQYFVKGVIKNIESTKWGNMTIEDEEGNTLYIYGTYDASGTTRYDSLANPPQEGDTVVLYGVIMRYVNGTTNKIEMKNGKIQSVS